MFAWVKRFFEKIVEVNTIPECHCDNCNCCEISEEELTKEALEAGCKCCEETDIECGCDGKCGCENGESTGCCECK